MELLVLVLLLFTMVSLIVVSYGMQQEKHKRHREWMKEQLKQDRSYND